MEESPRQSPDLDNGAIARSDKYGFLSQRRFSVFLKKYLNPAPRLAVKSSMTSSSHRDPSLLTARECAKHANVSVPTIRQLIRSGDLPARVLGFSVRVRTKDLDWWKDSLPSKAKEAGMQPLSPAGPHRRFVAVRREHIALPG